MPRSSIIASTAGAKTNHDKSRRERHELISRTLEKAIGQLNSPYYASDKDRLGQLVRKSICFPKNNNSNANSGKGNNGKPHDVETRIALTLYHQWRRNPTADSHSKESITNKSQQEPNQTTTGGNNCASAAQSPPSFVTITSDLGLSRELTSPRQLANLIVPFLEEGFRNNPHWNMAPDIRSQPSGIVSMISSNRSQILRLAGRLPCPYCIQWCKGEKVCSSWHDCDTTTFLSNACGLTLFSNFCLYNTKGLWWHQQEYHKVEHSRATAMAQATTINSGAMVLYTGPNIVLKMDDTSSRSVEMICDSNNEKNATNCDDNSSPMECVRQGNLDGLKEAVQKHGYRPCTAFDNKGATPLMWAAGGGHLDIARHLIEDCGCDPCQSQRGKRSFAGRTALHWAARNGHIEVVRYMITLTTSRDQNRGGGTNFPPSIPMHKLLEAKTQDGTTAFGWACWQRHLQVMECLYGHGCDIHALNSYGCSPVLWCSQGTNGNGLQALKWLRDKGCSTKLVNHNGHGVLHKAAQRGQRDVAEWLVREECSNLFAAVRTQNDSSENDTFLAMIGPDVEGYCPSDLAGMEGHEDFAEWLATIEIKVCKHLDCAPTYEIPKGYSFQNSSVSSSRIWEQYGGLRRIRSAVVSSDLY